LLEVLRAAGIEIDAPCGGAGTCGKCKVLITKNVPPPTWADQELLTPEEVLGGVRLACRIRLKHELEVHVFESHEHSLQKAPTFEADGKFNPALRVLTLELEPPSLKDQRSDAERLYAAIEAATEGKWKPRNMTRSLLAKLPRLLRDNEWQVEVVFDYDYVLAVRAPQQDQPICGAAIDIGTTTLAVYTEDMRSGVRMGTAALLNPQRSFGGDVVSRIEVVSKGEASADKLSERVVEGLNKALEESCAACGISPEAIFHVVVVGNPTMTHLFLGLDPTWLAAAPYITVQGDSYCVRAQELGLKVNPEARVFVLPSISAYIGADTVGVILATNMDQGKETALALDIGTNGEMVLVHEGNLWACSTAAGPAFEGANIAQGMRAEAGAISKVRLDDDVYLETIGAQAARGICGSGLLDAVAELVKAGVIEESGRMLSPEEAKAEGLPDNLVERLEETDQGARFRLTPPSAAHQVYLTQRDVREVQLAKSALRAGLEILLQQAQIGYDAVDHVYLAGAFGNYLDQGSAAQIGLIPPELLERVVPVGNAAGAGCELALTESATWGRIARIKRELKYVELSASREFQDLYIEHMMFPEL